MVLLRLLEDVSHDPQNLMDYEHQPHLQRSEPPNGFHVLDLPDHLNHTLVSHA